MARKSEKPLPKTTLAFCYASGQIDFAAKCPDGALPILRGKDKEVRDFMCGVSRHAYDGETLLVPGIPEAPNQSVALDNLQKFIAWITPSARKRGLSVGGSARR